MKPVAIRQRAEADVAAHARELEDAREGYGDLFIDAWLKEVRLLAQHPFLGRVRHFRTPGLRSWRVGRPFENYLVFFHRKIT